MPILSFIFSIAFVLAENSSTKSGGYMGARVIELFSITGSGYNFFKCGSKGLLSWGPKKFKVVTTIASMLQTISTSCEFNVKKMKFTEASQDFNHLVDKIFFETEHPNEKDFIDTIEKEIEKVKNQCKFLPLECKEKKVQSSQTPQPQRANYSTTI